VRRFRYRGSEEPAEPGPGRVMKGVVNVAETGSVACKSRATSNAGKGALPLRLATTDAMVRNVQVDAFTPQNRRWIPLYGSATRASGACCLSPVCQAEPDWVCPQRDTLPPCPETDGSPRNQGHSRTPKASRVSTVEHGNPDTSARAAKPGEPPGPVMSRTGGRASVVVRAWESRAHGKGRQ